MIRPDTSTKRATDVSAMFDEVSPSYDLINDVLTVGNDRLWRIANTRAVAPRPGMRILDLAAGTGTSSAALAAHGAHVVAADFSEGMLAEGRKRQAGNTHIEFVQADGMNLPFDDNSFDAATISYGLRNISDPRKALAELFRVVKPGGRVVVNEFSTPPCALVRVPYALYGRYVLPKVAGLLNRKAAAAYEYLNESIEQWPAQAELAAWLVDAGFERVAYRNLTFGIVALHRGFVPLDAVKNAGEGSAPPAASEPVAAKPVAAKPAAAKPAAEKPAAAKPQPKTTSKSKTAAAKPATAKTAGSKPAAAKPESAKPASTQPKPKPAAKPKPVATQTDSPKTGGTP